MQNKTIGLNAVYIVLEIAGKHFDQMHGIADSQIIACI